MLPTKRPMRGHFGPLGLLKIYFEYVWLPCWVHSVPVLIGIFAGLVLFCLTGRSPHCRCLGPSTRSSRIHRKDLKGFMVQMTYWESNGIWLMAPMLCFAWSSNSKISSWNLPRGSKTLKSLSQNLHPKT